jgi:hypothetical protein
MERPAIVSWRPVLVASKISMRSINQGFVRHWQRTDWGEAPVSSPGPSSQDHMPRSSPSSSQWWRKKTATRAPEHRVTPLASTKLD